MSSTASTSRDTPFLEVDLDVLERNLARAAADAHAGGLQLRPHAKTHKSPVVGRRQLHHGAVGLSLATVSEAEIFADAGFDDIFIAYPVWPSVHRTQRIRRLAERIRLRLGVDSAESAERLGRRSRTTRSRFWSRSTAATTEAESRQPTRGRWP